MAYKGIQAEIPAGVGSFNQAQSRTRRAPEDLEEAQGIVYEGRVWRKEPGAAAIDANGIAGTPSILAAYDWRPTSSTQYVVTAAADGKLYRESSSNLDAATLVSGLSTTARGMFIAAGAEIAGNNKKLFYTNRTNVVQVVSGTGATAADLASPAADWATTNQPGCLVHHGLRLWGFGNANDGHRIYGSGTKNHEDFLCEEAVQLSCYPGVGDRLVAGLSIQGYLYLWKTPEGIYWLDDTDLNKTYWRVDQVTDKIGAAASPFAVLPVLGNALFLSANGNFHLVSDLANDTVRFSNLGERMQIHDWLRANLNLARLNQVTSCWFENKSLAIFSLPSASSTTNDLRLMFDFTDYLSSGVVRFSWSQRDMGEALFSRLESDGIEHPAFGDNAGKVWKLDQAARTKASAGYLGQVRTVATDFGWLDPTYRSRQKNFDFLEVFFNPLGASTVTADIYYDDVYAFSVLLDANQERVIAPLGGSARTISVRFKNTRNSQDFSITMLRVWFTLGA